VTAGEVAIYYVPSLRALLVPILLVLAVIKFVLVASWFMHLRFDSRIFRRFFLTGVLLAITVFAVVLVYFFTNGGPAPVAS
jgi:cytochrome c oxidase subunit IV